MLDIIVRRANGQAALGVRVRYGYSFDHYSRFLAVITVGSVWAGRFACSSPWSSRLGESKALSWSGSRFIGIAVVCQFITARCTGFGVESPASYYVLRWIRFRFLFRSCDNSSIILAVASSLGVINRWIRNQCGMCVITFLFLLSCG